MPLIDAQRRHNRTGAIRIGNQVPTGKFHKDGRPKMRPAKLDTFRVTSPHRDVVDAVADLFGGTVVPWEGPKGPEFEVVTRRRELPVLVPRQTIDPNYEMWGNRFRARLCDGARERIRNTPCLCTKWDDHDHDFRFGQNCAVCSVIRGREGAPHQHAYVSGFCSECGRRRACKPTTRVNVMIRGVPSIGVFKVESHGINAATRLPAMADMVAEAPVPLPATLGMRFEDQPRLVVDAGGRESVQVRQFWVPELHWDWLTPDMAYAGSARLEAAARAQIAASGGQEVLPALAAAPHGDDPVDPDEPPLTPDDVRRELAACTNGMQVRELWNRAKASGIRDDRLADELKVKAATLPPIEQPPAPREPEPEPDPGPPAGEPDVVDAEIVTEKMREHAWAGIPVSVPGSGVPA